MKYTKVSSLLFGAVALMALGTFTSCETEFYHEEQYRKEIYIVSDEENIFEQEFTFGDEATGYLSVYAGGTTPIEHEVTVVLEENESLLREYNQKLYGTSYDDYALKLPDSRFEVESWEVTLYPDEETPYSLFPIKVDINGLEPEDTYFLPIRIASVSDYMISEDKRDVMLQVFMSNDYATTASTTYYTMNGTMTTVDYWSGWTALSSTTTINSTKSVAPVTEYGIRILPGTVSTTDRATLRLEGLVATVHPDEYVSVALIDDDGILTGEYKECQLVTMENWYDSQDAITVYDIDETPSYYDEEEQTFTLYYRYNYDSDYWYEMYEVLTPVDISND